MPPSLENLIILAWIAVAALLISLASRRSASCRKIQAAAGVFFFISTSSYGVQSTVQGAPNPLCQMYQAGRMKTFGELAPKSRSKLHMLQVRALDLTPASETSVFIVLADELAGAIAENKGSPITRASFDLSSFHTANANALVPSPKMWEAAKKESPSARRLMTAFVQEAEDKVVINYSLYRMTQHGEVGHLQIELPATVVADWFGDKGWKKAQYGTTCDID